ncbi:MTH938/NDUFAF3 family protein [Orrella sp. JC864]|uniref:Mth938-like domain-containing protein n=1 Tax=Orrella sp. JC864 TaxID=3120298 RepID=UPI00300A0CFE
MKLHNDTTSALNTVTAYGNGYIEVNRVSHTHAIAFGPQGAIDPWPVASAADITTTLLRQAAGIPEPSLDPLAFLDAPEAAAPRLPPDAPEVLLVGTGSRQVFLAHAVLQPLLSAGLGIETMDTQAAARTYNILMAEGRRVRTALIPEETQP